VEKLAAVGAVFLGKTNMDEFAMGSTNETSAAGAVRNRGDRTRIPADRAAVPRRPSLPDSPRRTRLRLTAVPSASRPDSAAWWGLKPTYGRVPATGSSLCLLTDQIGPLTRQLPMRDILKVIAWRRPARLHDADAAVPIIRPLSTKE
jgi:aspartyl-tRNA(Asn)/glutamyl-tRNA(Gln) amidotransferase subunit A